MFMLVTIIIVLWVINLIIKTGSVYKNKYLFSLSSDGITGCNLIMGSTYALFDCQAIRNQNKYEYCNCGGFSRPIMYDYHILKKYVNKKHIENIVLFLGGCVCMCSPQYEDTSGSHYSMLRLWEMNSPNVKQWIMYHVPVLFFWKFMGKKGDQILTYDEKYAKMIGTKDCEALMQDRARTWCSQFALDDLKNDDIGKNNEINIEKNIQIIRQIKKMCEEKQTKLWIVVPPFSRYLNDLISDEFAEKTLMNPIKSIIEMERVLDYRKKDYFQLRDDLFVDGGFLLNSEGSKMFVDMLVHDMKG